MRKLTITPLLIAATIALSSGVASAHPGHISCRGFGLHNASEAHQQIIDDEVRSFGPGNVDDVIALVHLGGTFGGEVIPAFCAPK
ncbi:MAG: hypothetical protein ACR2IR_02880 [Acidimicrobiia bacterium]